MTRKKNPVDRDKTAENPGLLPFAHHIGSAIIRPLDKGKEKGLAMQAMYEQTENSLQQIRKQVETLISQAQHIHDRIEFSEKIYEAECSFVPVIGRTYYLYERPDGSRFLSMINPVEWGNGSGLIFICGAKLLADHTWNLIEDNQ